MRSNRNLTVWVSDVLRMCADGESRGDPPAESMRCHGVLGVPNHLGTPDNMTVSSHHTSGAGSARLNRPNRMPVNLDGIPLELRRLDQWVLWKFTLASHGRKWTKRPVQADEANASVTNPQHWCSFADVSEAYRSGRFDGIGFVFVRNGGYCGVDLDNHRDPQTGELDEFAKRILASIPTYAEVSPSSTGIKLFCRGALPAGPRVDHDQGVETYESGRYFAVTGQLVPGAPSVCEDRTTELAQVLPEIFASRRCISTRAIASPCTEGSVNSTNDKRATALEALAAISPSRARGYTDWLQVGQALHSVDSSESMLAEWDRWSQRCPEKYSEGVCADKWRSFQSGGGLNLASLVYWARQYGRIGTSHGQPQRCIDGGCHESVASAPRSYALTDYGNAERLRDRFGAEIRYCHPFGKWLCWDGRRWTEDQTGRVKQLAKQTGRAMWDEVKNLDGQDDRRALAAHALRSESARSINAQIELARDEVPILPADLDNEPWLLNCLNGTLDLRTGELREHRCEDFISKLCPVTFDLHAECPNWQKFLHGVFDGRESLIDYMRRLVGYCLTGQVSEQVLPILYGVGANGKSTFLNIVLKMLGSDYAMQGIPDLLMTKRNESHPTERADLFGKRFVSCVETEDGRALAESLVKQLTGGENIRARRMREDFWQFNPTHKVFLCTNHKPRIRGTDHAIWRRIRLIPFSVKFWNPDKGESGLAKLRQDKGLPEKLESELPGILAWAVRGCLEWQTNGLGMPDEVNAATSAYQVEQDVLGQWLAECCLTGALYKAKSSDLYADYRRWCEAHGEHTINNRQFGSALSERGFERFTNNGTWYRGVGLLDNQTRGATEVTEPTEPISRMIPPAPAHETTNRKSGSVPSVPSVTVVGAGICPCSAVSKLG